ncbi:hypothetical protein [Lysobacter sp. Hz 25]|uniref:hypothetical protein n=1 Tax=Lysobacter sp. Hz 25 TaxID=3383698 RepID=UPI0038D39C95
MNDKWKGSGYDPQKAWAKLKREQWEKANPGSWKDGWLALGAVLALVATVGGLAVAALKLFRVF